MTLQTTPICSTSTSLLSFNLKSKQNLVLFAFKSGLISIPPDTASSTKSVLEGVERPRLIRVFPSCRERTGYLASGL